VIAVLSLVAACGGDKDPTGITGGISGTVSFNYTGGGNGSFNATGSILATASENTAHTTTWAAGFRDNTADFTSIGGNLAMSGGVANTVTISANRETTGSFTISADCDESSANACGLVGFVVGHNQDITVFSFICALETGTVTIASLSTTRATGSFSGTGECINSQFQSSAFAITNGSFDVPLFSTEPAF